MRNASLFAIMFPTLLLMAIPGLRAEQFVYKHTAGDKYRILSTVCEDVYVNRRLALRSEILNRVAVDVLEAEGGTGRHRAVFQTAERAVRAERTAEGQSFRWEREYESEFQRDEQGFIVIDRQYYMPVVRNVPVFPDRDIRVGETWIAEGHEMHDFRDSFGVN